MSLTTLFFRSGPPAKCSILGAAVLVAVASALVGPVLADGCFVFHWDKKTDINEPTQKAIIVYDAGREEMLLQVKYEGPLDEFGWLIPVPSLPTVEKGSMEPFYELSQLTQPRISRVYAGRSLGTAGEAAAVKVVEIKTVGAYEVGVLSAQDAGRLAQWLKNHGYTLPDGRGDVIDGYIRQGWYFIAAKIQLNSGDDFKVVAGRSSNETAAPPQSRDLVQKQLSSGELHPLRISFDSPRCVFPLKISSVGGKPSEVSLYVLAREPCLEKSIYDNAVQKVRQQMAEHDRQKASTEEMRHTAIHNQRALGLAFKMYTIAPRGQGQRSVREWSLADLDAMIGEETNDLLLPPLESYGYSGDACQSLALKPGQIPKCAEALPRLKNGLWYLTKQVCTFQPEEMHDLEFQPALPILRTALATPGGGMASTMLWLYGAKAVPILISACQSTNSIERINASSLLQSFDDPRLVGTIRALFKDDEPQVRYNAMMASFRPGFDFKDELMALFHDPCSQIRWQAAQWLYLQEPSDRAPVYVALLHDPDPNVRSCAFNVLTHINRAAIPRTAMLDLLGSPILDAVLRSEALLENNWPAEPEFLAKAPAQPPCYVEPITSAETVYLTTNRFILARLTGLKILREHADADSVQLTLPLLRDTNSLVRTRAFSLLRAVTGQDISTNDPAKWEQWWSTNKATFRPPKPTR